MRTLNMPRSLLGTLWIAIGVLLIGGAGAASASEAPVVTSVTPNVGTGKGGTRVTIRGGGLTGASVVDFGAAPAALHAIHATEIVVSAPAGSGTVDVTVTTPEGTSATGPNDLFSYTPVVTKVSPTSGPVTGGTPVTISGAGLGEASAVHFGSIPASSFTVLSPTSIQVTSPPTSAVAGVTDVTVTTPTGTSPAKTDKFKYLPVVTAVNPSAGSTGGGTTVTVHGAGFALGSGTSFTFGTYLAPTSNCISTSECQVTSPTVPPANKNVNVKAIVNGLKSSPSTFVSYRYIPPQSLYLVEAESLHKLAEGAMVNLDIYLEGPAGEHCQASLLGEVSTAAGYEVGITSTGSYTPTCEGAQPQRLYGPWAGEGSLTFYVTFAGQATLTVKSSVLGIYQPDHECAYQAETMSGSIGVAGFERFEAELAGTFQLVEGLAECVGSVSERASASVSIAAGGRQVLIGRVK
jgi:hypothetical protein